MVKITSEEHAVDEVRKYYQIFGLKSIHWHPATDQIEVEAMRVQLHDNWASAIPLQLHTVKGNFSCSGANLKSLENSPRIVTGNFNCTYNLLKDLVGGPSHVGGDIYNCSDNFLNSYEGAPPDFQGLFQAKGNLGAGLRSVDHVPPGAKVSLTWSKNLPLLKLLQNPSVVFFHRDSGMQVTIINDIFARYAGAGKSVMLNCALELKKHGFEGNARW